MRSHKKYAAFEFIIERVKDLTTDQYRLVKDDDDIERVEGLVLEVEGVYYFYPGNYFGPSEDCYPDDSERQILSIKWKGKSFPWDLTKEETQSILDQIEFGAS